MTAHTLIAAAMTEDELQANVVDLCRVLGLRWYHTHDSRRSPAGFPDLVIVGRGILYRELKSTRGRLSTDQLLWLNALERAGADVAVWRPAQWPDQIRQELEHMRMPRMLPPSTVDQQTARQAALERDWR